MLAQVVVMSIQVHHLNCGSFCPLIGSAALCHCLLLETEAGLVLVDTGFGHAVSLNPEERMQTLVRLTLRPGFDVGESALQQIRDRGFDPRDVRHIIVTHLDADHAGGISDFPHAAVHVYAPERAAAIDQADANSRNRYNPGLWMHGVDWRVYSVNGEPWYGFEAVRQLQGLPPEILLVPLSGHSRGHAGVALQTSAGWILHAGDAYIAHQTLRPESGRAPLSVRFAEYLSAWNPKIMYANQERLRMLHRDYNSQVSIFSAHSIEEFRNAVRNPMGS